MDPPGRGAGRMAPLPEDAPGQVQHQPADRQRQQARQPPAAPAVAARIEVGLRAPRGSRGRGHRGPARPRPPSPPWHRPPHPVDSTAMPADPPQRFPRLSRHAPDDYDRGRISDRSRTHELSGARERNMVFGLGPVLRYELITTARRGRYYLARVVYGSVLLFLLWGAVRSDWEFASSPRRDPEELHQFAESTFIVFAQTQLTALLCPAAGPGGRGDRRRASAEDPALPAGQSALEPRDHAGQAGRPAGARRDLRGPGTAGGRPAVALGGLDPGKVLTIYFGTFTTVLSVVRAVDLRLGAGASAARRDPGRVCARGDLAARPAGHRPDRLRTSAAS